MGEWCGILMRSCAFVWGGYVKRRFVNGRCVGRWMAGLPATEFVFWKVRLYRD
ncbi:MAG: hypothetical protein H6728_09990 [Myxococcales bacterium]|nr:hypothetical protein [Myxococcales bacterium]MCB9643392.1 hypothetical protein [Myxococcales bacterium]